MNYKYLFGPVPSRRLGVSLGVDLIPSKVCSHNCIYCEVGKTTKLTINREEYVSLAILYRELEDFLHDEPDLDYITFSGSGEPTLNSRIGELINWLKENYPQYKLACITNSSLLWDKLVRRELLPVDLMLPSLDAVSEEIYRKLNRPYHLLSAKMIVDGLIDFRKEYKGQIWLEIFLSPQLNDQPEELALLKAACRKIKPDRIQLNTLDRPGVIKGLKPLSQERLAEIVEFFEPLPAEIIAKAQVRKLTKSYDKDISASILETIRRRPCTDNDLSQILGLHINELNKYLSSLLADGQIAEQEEERGTFFVIKEK